jgi:hypothetical protein
MAKDILKEAIADAKAVREVALANAKAALEEAFTPKLQSMLSAKLSEELEEEYNEDENIDEMYYEEDEDMDEDMDEVTGMEMEEMRYDEDDMDEKVHDKNDMAETNLDEEIDLEEILNELELEEGDDSKEETVDEAKDMDEETMDEAKDDVEEEKLDEMEVTYNAATTNRAGYKADYVHESEDFDLDALLKEIESLEEKEDDDSKKEMYHSKKEMYHKSEAKEEMDEIGSALGVGKTGGIGSSPLQPQKGETIGDYEQRVKGKADKLLAFLKSNPKAFAAAVAEEVDMSEELEETKAALETVRAELNEVNLLNSKLLYVNRIFKANTLDEVQKLRVVETLDKADSAKEAKLIYETIKDTFTVANNKKTSFKNKTKSLKEGIGMASRAAGNSTAPKKEIISESSNMVNRFQKLANIKINE